MSGTPVPPPKITTGLGTIVPTATTTTTSTTTTPTASFSNNNNAGATLTLTVGAKLDQMSNLNVTNTAFEGVKPNLGSDDDILIKANPIIPSRVAKLAADKSTLDMAKVMKDAVNGILDHELSTGSTEYIKHQYRICVPFDANAQFMFTLSQDPTGSVKNAALITIARVGLIAWWADFLEGVDTSEAFPFKEFDQNVADSTNVGKRRVKINEMQDLTYGKWAMKVDKDVDNPVSLKITDAEYQLIPEVTAAQLILHMKDVAMLVAMNLVRTRHHYQTNVNGSFRAMERKRWGKEIFSEDDRGIIYHEAMHPFVQAAKLFIYNKALVTFIRGTIKNIEPFNKLDDVVLKRLPVVPAGAAWLQAGVTVMNEIVSIPGLSEKIDLGMKELMLEADVYVKQVKATGRVNEDAIQKYAGIAAFAYGALKELTPEHSALKAPSFKKNAEAHIGNMTAGAALARTFNRSL